MELPRDRCFQALSTDNSIDEITFAADHLVRQQADLDIELCMQILNWLRDEYFDGTTIKLHDLLTEVDDMDRIEHPDWPKAEMTAVAAALRTMAVRLAVYGVLTASEQEEIDFDQAEAAVLQLWRNE